MLKTDNASRPRGGSGASAARAEAQTTLKTVQDRGTLICGVSQGLAGFSIKDDKGEWSGFDVDFCRALAAAIFNDPSKVQFVPLSASSSGSTRSRTSKIDVLSRNSTWTMGREGDYGILFTGITYYDGQAFLVPKSRNVDLRARARRQQGLRPARHDDGAQRHRLLRNQPYEIRDRPRGERRRDDRGLSGRQVQRADDRRVAALRAPLSSSPSPAIT